MWIVVVTTDLNQVVGIWWLQHASNRLQKCRTPWWMESTGMQELSSAAGAQWTGVNWIYKWAIYGYFMLFLLMIQLTIQCFSIHSTIGYLDHPIYDRVLKTYNLWAYTLDRPGLLVCCVTCHRKVLRSRRVKKLIALRNSPTLQNYIATYCNTKMIPHDPSVPLGECFWFYWFSLQNYSSHNFLHLPAWG